MIRSFLLYLVLAAAVVLAQEDWRRPYPAYTIAGNLHYVGTEGLACFLFTTPKGHILINTGLEDSTPLLRTSLKQLGFRLEDVRILLTMQGHHDHVGAMSEVKRISGAKLFITAPDTPSLEDGGLSDPVLSAPKYRFPPVNVDRRLKDGDTVELGGTVLKVILTPGHTKGSVTYSTTVVDKGKTLRVLLANMGSVVMPLVNNAKYPGIASDFETSFAKQKRLSCDIWVAAHGGQYRMLEKHKAGNFIDPDGYRQAVEDYERIFRETLAKERAATK